MKFESKFSLGEFVRYTGAGGEKAKIVGIYFGLGRESETYNIEFTDALVGKSSASRLLPGDLSKTKQPNELGQRFPVPEECKCPKCGEDNADDLVWTYHDEVECQTCKTIYTPPMRPGGSNAGTQ